MTTTPTAKRGEARRRARLPRYARVDPKAPPSPPKLIQPTIGALLRPTAPPPARPPLPGLPPGYELQPRSASAKARVLRDGRLAPGITRALARRFYPHYERRSASGARWARGGASTEDLGSRIEEQIEATLAARAPAARCRHAWARAVCVWAEREGLELVSAQHPIHDPASGLTTLADFILCDPHWAEFKRTPYVLLELKTGHSYDMDEAQGTFAAPLEAVPATLRNACYAQLAWMQCVLERVHGVPTRAVLAVVNNTTAASVRGCTAPLPDDMRAMAPQLVDGLCAFTSHPASR